MRQVPASPTAYFNRNLAQTILDALLRGAPKGPGTTLETARRNLGSNRLADAVAEDATELYARAIPSSRLTIESSMVEAFVNAAVDILGSDRDLNALDWALKDVERSDKLRHRADALYHAAMYASTQRTAGGSGDGLSYEERH